MKNITASNDLKSVKDLFEMLARKGGYSHSALFSDLVAFMFHFYRTDNREGALETLRKYDPEADIGNREELILTGQGEGLRLGEKKTDCFWQILQRLNWHMATYEREILGALYREYGAHDRTSQVLEASDIPLCSKLFDQSLPREICGPKDTSGGEILFDPRCGAGNKLITWALTQPPHYIDKSIFMGMDKDLICARMFALNLFFFKLDGLAAHGNALTGETWGVWRIVNKEVPRWILVELPRDEWPGMFRRVPNSSPRRLK